MPAYRNISYAVVGSVQDLLRDGTDVVVKDELTKELVARNTRLERPLERYLFVPRRHHDITSQFAESMWVLAGRNDIGWLTNTCRERRTSPMTATLGAADTVRAFGIGLELIRSTLYARGCWPTRRAARL